MNKCTIKSPFFRNDRVTFKTRMTNKRMVLDISSYEYETGEHTDSMFSEYEIIKLHKFLTKVIINYKPERSKE